MMSPEEFKARMARAIAKLDELEASGDTPQFYERAYPVDIALPLVSPTTDGIFPSVAGTLEVVAGTTFFAKGIEASYTVTGSLSDGSPATLPVPPSLFPLIFDYNWLIRDNGSDRDWVDRPMPAAVMRGGNVQGFRFGRGQARLTGGTQVAVTINPIFFDQASTATGLATFTSHSLQVVLTGVEVVDGVL